MTKGSNIEEKSVILNQNQIAAVDEFASQVNEAILKSRSVLSTSKEEDDNEEQPFISFTLKGPKAPRKTKAMSESQRIKVEEQKKLLWGRMREVKGRLISLREKKKKSKGGKGNQDASTLFLQLTIKFYGATDVAKNWDLNINMKQEIIKLILGLGDSSSTISEWGQVGNRSELNFHSGEIELTNGSWKLDLKQKAKCKFVKNKKKNNTKKIESLSHDQRKNVLLDPSALFFQRLGITDSNGKPKQAKSSKLRQCQKFVEVVSGLLSESLLSSMSMSDNKTDRPSIITHDMGCGRGYLTFSLHSHLYERFKDQFDVQSRGVDMRPKLVKEINGIAAELGKDFDGLRFLTGTIEDTQTGDNIDILIALHACDTATDDSIWYGIQKKASLIVTAPCCHKEVRRYLNAHVSEVNDDHPYADVLRHNIYKERIAETVTDSMRAILLEIAGYDVQVFEFIGGEHTNKNVMITATKRDKLRTSSQKQQLRTRLQSLAQLHGIQNQRLASLMDEVLYEYEGMAPTKRNAKKSKKFVNTGMPPL